MKARQLLIAIPVLAALAAAALVAAGYALVHAPGGHSTAVVLEVAPGSSVRKVAATLAEREVLEHPGVFEAYVRLRGQSARLKAGEYLVPPAATPAELVELLVSGEVMLHPVTIVEGWTWRETLDRLAAQQVLQADLAGLGAADLMARLGRQGEHPEGRFFPDTYHVARGTAVSQVLEMAMARMDQELARAWQARASDLPLETPYQALVLASIVEKETALASERPAIAGVFTRRLQRRMRLQTDPTVIYGLGADFDGNLRRADLERDGPYNTYTRAGLPPTPICMPSGEALVAATRPEPGDALYFVATGQADGSHYFSGSLEEHNRAVARYLKTLREARKRQ